MSPSGIESGKVARAFDLSGRVAIVTGAASGIGRAAVERLSGHAVDVVAVDERRRVVGRGEAARRREGEAARPEGVGGAEALGSVARKAAPCCCCANTI